MAGWTRAAAAMTVPYDERRAVHPQSAGFTDHERWDSAATPADRYPLQDHHPYFDLYREVGHLELAADSLAEASRLDLDDLHRTRTTACTWRRSPASGSR